MAQWEEEASCPLCKSEHNYEAAQVLQKFSQNSSTINQHSETNLHHPNDLYIIQCKKCGLFFLSPRLKKEAMHKVYETMTYFKGNSNVGYNDYEEQKKTLILTFNWFLKKLKRKKLIGGALLDVGCGSGLFLEKSKPFFSKTVGTDLCKDMANEAAKRCDVALCGGPLAAKKFGPFNLITTIGVIEHIYNPIDFLEECVALLAPGGHIILVTPNIKGIWYKIMKKRWPSFKLPEHIAYYHPDAMRELAKRTSMTLKGFFSYHQVFPLSLVLKYLGFSANKKNKILNIEIPLPWVMMATILKKNDTYSR